MVYISSEVNKLALESLAQCYEYIAGPRGQDFMGNIVLFGLCGLRLYDLRFSIL